MLSKGTAIERETVPTPFFSFPGVPNSDEAGIKKSDSHYKTCPGIAVTNTVELGYIQQEPPRHD